MASYFVDGTAGISSGPGTSWLVPYQTVAQALAAAVTASDTSPVIAVGSTGTFTATAAITWTLPSTGNVTIVSATNPGSGTTITPAAGATEQVGAAAAAFSITLGGTSSAYVFGMSVKAGSTANAASTINIFNSQQHGSLEMESCTFDLPSTTTNSIGLGTQTFNHSQFIKLRSCTFHCTGSRTGVYFSIEQAKVEIINPTFSFAGASKPAELIQGVRTGASGQIIIRDGDVSGFAGTAIVLLTAFDNASVILENLKINASTAITQGTWVTGSHGWILVRNCSTPTPLFYRIAYYDPYGSLVDESTIYKNGGATFGSGATTISWQIITSSLCNRFYPFRVPFLMIWTTLTSAQTAVIEFAQDVSATALTDQDIWSDLGASANATDYNYSYQTNRNAAPITGTPANQPTSTATWTGLTTPTTQKLNNAFTASQIGMIQSMISIGKASTTLYINPQLDGVS